MSESQARGFPGTKPGDGGVSAYYKGLCQGEHVSTMSNRKRQAFVRLLRRQGGLEEARVRRLRALGELRRGQYRKATRAMASRVAPTQLTMKRRAAVVSADPLGQVHQSARTFFKA